MEYLYEEIVATCPSNIFILGDFFDSRKQIDWRVLNYTIEFFSKIQELGDKRVIIVVGNHDSYFKNTIAENSVSFLAKMFSNVSIIDKTQFVKFNDKNLLFVPWLIDENDDNNPTLLQIKSADMILGHFEFINFQLLPGVMSTHGFSDDDYKNKRVLSGHYHIGSERNSVKYLGVCEQMNWTDFNERKGIHILDEELELTFVENTRLERFVKLWFDSTNEKPITVEGYTIGVPFRIDSVQTLLKKVDVDVCNFRVYLKDISNRVAYNNFIVALDVNNISYTIIDVTPEMHQLIYNDHEVVTDEDENINDMLLKLLNDDNKKKLFSEIYAEAIQLGEI
jgi:DNA repair exonuclease SbcCD nuclease subunit